MARLFPEGVLATVVKTGPPGPLNWCPIPTMTRRPDSGAPPRWFQRLH